MLIPAGRNGQGMPSVTLAPGVDLGAFLPGPASPIRPPNASTRPVGPTRPVPAAKSAPPMLSSRTVPAGRERRFLRANSVPRGPRFAALCAHNRDRPAGQCALALTYDHGELFGKRRTRRAAEPSARSATGNPNIVQVGVKLNDRGDVGSRTRVLRDLSKSSPSAACFAFLSPGDHAGNTPTGSVTV
jgi:hypothetical protein